MSFLQKQNPRPWAFSHARWRHRIDRPKKPRCRRERRRVVTPAFLPTALTLSNGLCGLGSILMASGAVVAPHWVDAGLWAALLIFLGMVFDMLDGQAARWLKKTSTFGTQLDSLCDAITFAAAPVFILLNLCGSYSHIWVVIAGAVFMACALLRLARFNTEATSFEPHDYFSGLPSPAAAGTVASFAIAIPDITNWTGASTAGAMVQLEKLWVPSVTIGVPVLTVVLACLMVSKLPYPHVINQWMGRRHRVYQLGQLGLVVLAGVVVHVWALPLAFCFFVLEPLSHRLMQNVGQRRVVMIEGPDPQD